jgi:5-methylcytosine-specific restriction enzyme subunit McrC
MKTITGHIGSIPVRNLWLLMLYASDLFRQLERKKVAIEESPDDIPALVAEILAHLVERRLKRNLSFGYQASEAVLSRVRGHIDMLGTERRQLLYRGKIACRFEDLTVNTPRNRFVRAALDSIARIVSKPQLAHRCRSLSCGLGRLGVSHERPSRLKSGADRFGHHDSEDRFMLAAAQLAFDLALPTEDCGDRSLMTPDRDIHWVRRLYEKAIGGFYNVVLTPKGWSVSAGRTLGWQIEQKTSGIDALLPSMRTDVILEHRVMRKRLVIDTKFTSILKPGWYREKTFNSNYVYQLYAYLRSQESEADQLARNASGMLLHPAVGGCVDESVVIQGHSIRFATVDLGATTAEIRNQLLKLVESPVGISATSEELENA